MASVKCFTSFLLVLCVFVPTLVLSDLSITSKFLEHANKPEVFDWMVGIRNDLHEYPELLYDVFETSERVRQELDNLKIPYESSVAKTGVIGYVGTMEEPFVALRADMDGLPIHELVEWEHKSKIDGKMHACGHDAHTAMLLGASKILKEHEKELQGTVLLVFQPAEEGGAGAREVWKTGLLKEVKAIFGLHVAPDVPVGVVGSRAGDFMAGSGTFEAVITGEGGHAAQPHLGIDPVVAAANVIISLQHLISREAEPGDPQVVTVAKLEGSDAFNVIPNTVTIGGSFRAFSTIRHLSRRIEEVIVAQAAVSKCSAAVNFFEDVKPLYPAVNNNEKLYDHFKNVATQMLGPQRVLEAPQVTVSEDFAFYQEEVPGLFFFLGIKNETHGEEPVHSAHFDIAQDAFPYGAALHASLVTTYLSDVLGSQGKQYPRDEL